MSIKSKVDLVINLFYNFVLAILFSVIAEVINVGDITWTNLVIDIFISYILEMLIVAFLPFVRWGERFAFSKAVPGTKKFRVLCALVTATCFATLMSAAMSFVTCIIILRLPIMAWVVAWMRIWGIFVVIAWICSYFMIPFFHGFVKKSFIFQRTVTRLLMKASENKAELKLSYHKVLRTLQSDQQVSPTTFPTPNARQYGE